MMLTKENFKIKVEAQLTELRTEIEALKTHANKVEGEARIKFNQELAELSAQLEVVPQKLAELKQISLEALGKTEADIDNSLSSLEQHLEQLVEAAQRTREKILGWAQGMADNLAPPSEGWAEGMGHQGKTSEGWAEGMGHLTPDSKDSIGWAEGMETSQPSHEAVR